MFSDTSDSEADSNSPMRSDLGRGYAIPKYSVKKVRILQATSSANSPCTFLPGVVYTFTCASKQYRNSIKTVPKQYQNSIKTVPKTEQAQ